MIEHHAGLDIVDSFSIDAMNTNFYFAVTNCNQANWKEVLAGWVRYVEKEWSRFRAGNELGQLNGLTVGDAMTISPPLFDVLKCAEEYRQTTNSLFSPYLLPQMRFHGYEASFPFDSGRFTGSTMPPVNGIDASPLRFDSRTFTVTRIAEGFIDLGGIGKGYAVQAAARWLKRVGAAAAGMVDGGGDMTVWSDGSKEWTIGVSHPFQEDAEIAQFRLKNGSVATSNIVYRSWLQGNERKHHILNGRTGLPVNNDYIQATVIAENCLDAEVGAKLCLIEEETNMKSELKNLSSARSFLLVNQLGKVVAGEMEE
ncbi:FAD:protein FMN transferase [Neobacillus sp. 19]|uniref:FAD:protein FMN transferase n=1 Tax=Neobacillus sp. 19 TaxID=3394458 RepID=UPI003BF6643B